MMTAGSPGVRCSSPKTVRATTPMTGMVARIRRAISGSTTPRALHGDVPEQRGAELQDPLHVLAEAAGDDELPPGHIRHLVVGDELDLLGDLLLLGRVGLPDEVRAQLLDGLVGGPAEPGLLAGPADSGVHGGGDHVHAPGP